MSASRARYQLHHAVPCPTILPGPLVLTPPGYETGGQPARAIDISQTRIVWLQRNQIRTMPDLPSFRLTNYSGWFGRIPILGAGEKHEVRQKKELTQVYRITPARLLEIGLHLGEK